MWGVQRRMADWNFAKAATWAELELVHTQWVEDYNSQEHWAHQKREDGRRSPKAVLDWVQGRGQRGRAAACLCAGPAFGRADRSGYVRFRRWRLYGERGLARKELGVWLTSEQLTLVYSDEPLAQYRATYERDHHHLQTVQEARLYLTPFQSPQPFLCEPHGGEWLRVLRVRVRPAQRRRRVLGEQRALFEAAD